MEKQVQTIRTVLYAIFEDEFLGPSFPYYCTLSLVSLDFKDNLDIVSITYEFVLKAVQSLMQEK